METIINGSLAANEKKRQAYIPATMRVIDIANRRILCTSDLPNMQEALLTGPIASGKTTFLQYITNENIPNGASGAPRKYQVNNTPFNKVTDFSGADAWLKGSFDKYINEHGYILFFCDVAEYIRDLGYRKNANARMDMIVRCSKPSQIVLLVGTHIDMAPKKYNVKFEQHFAGKPYIRILYRKVYVNTTQKECVQTILNALKD
ncbi:MAG: GTPase domain-containing protein [Bacteroidales bacterium]|nr:GTPase domain-containing protein [Bacteroidales bacterium]